uniref:Uncharacterized protein n=1 Tax=Romanomermis culicivorax TaxID=13658 RepID=A0A915ITC4_ROMCU
MTKLKRDLRPTNESDGVCCDDFKEICDNCDEEAMDGQSVLSDVTDKTCFLCEVSGKLKQ